MRAPAHALLLTARQLARVMAGARRQADAAEHRAGRCTRIVAARQLQRQHDVLQCGQRWQQMKRLEHEADALGPQARTAVLVQRTQALPASMTSPALGRSSPASSASSVDLPAPDGPTSAIDSRARP